METDCPPHFRPGPRPHPHRHRPLPDDLRRAIDAINGRTRTY